MLYKIKIKTLSDFIGEIKANTLMGAFCGACSLIFGNESVGECVEDVTFSDLFHMECTPYTIKNNIVQYSNFDYSKTKKSYATRTLIARENSDKNNIDILNSTSSDYYFTFYLHSQRLFDYETLSKVLSIMFILGIGKWRNVGKGQFELLEVKEITDEFVAQVNNSKRLVSLSDFKTENPNELNNLLSVGYTVRNARATNGKKQEQQILLKCGSTFRNMLQNNTDVLIVGQHIYDKNSETYIHGRTILKGV